jgi:hypothetical protein
MEWEKAVGGYTAKNGEAKVDYDLLQAHPDWAKWEAEEDQQDGSEEERLTLLETVPTTLVGLAALLEYLWTEGAGGEMLCTPMRRQSFCARCTMPPARLQDCPPRKGVLQARSRL